MTKDRALHAWFEGFGMTAYPVTSVPDDAEFPWLTYEAVVGEFGSEVSCAVNLWFWTDSEAEPNAKAESFRQYIKDNDYIDCDEGKIWVKTGEPWCQSVKDEVSPTIKRRYLNLILEYFTD